MTGTMRRARRLDTVTGIGLDDVAGEMVSSVG